MAVPGGSEIKKGRASLVGGIAVGLAVLCLWVLIARDLGAGGGVSLLCACRPLRRSQPGSGWPISEAAAGLPAAMAFPFSPIDMTTPLPPHGGHQ